MKALILLSFVLLCFAQVEDQGPVFIEDGPTMQLSDLSMQALILINQNNLAQAQQRIKLMKDLLQSPLIKPGPNPSRDRSITIVISRLAERSVFYFTNDKFDLAKTYLNMLIDLNNFPPSTPEGGPFRSQALEPIIIKLSEVAQPHVTNRNLEQAKVYINWILQIANTHAGLVQGSAELNESINYLIARLALNAVYYINNGNLEMAKVYVNLLIEVNKINASTAVAKEQRNKLIEPIMFRLSQRAIFQIQNGNLELAKTYVNYMIEVNNIPTSIPTERSIRDTSVSDIMAKLSERAVIILGSNDLEKAQGYVNLALEVNKIPVISSKGKEQRKEAVKAVRNKLVEGVNLLINRGEMLRAKAYADLARKLDEGTA